MTAAATTPVTSRFTNSIMAWYSSEATNWSSSQFGQSLQPRPDPVSRTDAPVITIAVNDQSAHRANCTNRSGEITPRRYVRVVGLGVSDVA